MTDTELIERYEQGTMLLEQALRDILPDALDRVPAPDKWTIRQILVHVADADIVYAGRIRAIAAEPGTQIMAFDQDKWTLNLPYSNLPVELPLAVIRALRRSTTTLLRGLPPDAWERKAVHSERGEVSLRDMVESVANHAESHARQIREHRARFAA